MQRYAARHFALPVEFSDPAPFVASQFNARDILHQNGRAAIGLDHDVFNVANPLQIAASAHHVLMFAEFERAAANIHVAATDNVADLGEWDIERTKPAGIDHYIILFDEAADASDLSNALGLREPEAYLPVLERTQRRQRFVFTENGILVNPTDPAGVGPKRRRHAGRNALGCCVEVF